MAKQLPKCCAYLFDYVGEETNHITEKKPQVEIIVTQ